MRQVFDRLFARFGRSFLLGENTITGFFYSVNSRSWQNMEQMVGPLGEIPRGQYICILPADVTVAAGDTVQVGQTAYRIRRAEAMWAGDEMVYHWCLCVEEGGEDQW